MASSLQCMIRVFQLICFLLASYMTYLQFSRYIANGDVSTITFRTFNNEEQDIYPSYSMCFKGSNGEIFKQEGIKSIWNDLEYDKGAKMYQDALRGGSNFSTEVIQKDFDDVTIDFFKEIFVSLETDTKDGETQKHENIPLYISYQDSRYICVTRDVPFEKDLLITRDRVMLRPEAITNQSLSLLIFLHQTGSLTTSLLSDHEPLIEFRYQDFLELFAMYEEFYQSKSFYTTDVRINQVEVLRKRADGVVPCHDDEEYNEDLEWILKVATEIGCVPIFWRGAYLKNNSQMIEELASLTECSTEVQYSQTDNYTSRYNIMKKLNPVLKPCTQTSIFSSLDIYYVSNENEHEFLLKISHISEEYKETLNVKGFDEETLLSTVGGYIGIFLGYSLLQLPSIMIDVFSWLYKRNSRARKN